MRGFPLGASISKDPFATLGVSPDADESQVRARYLELVKQYPPEQHPEKFREIRAAFEAASDPLTLALRLIESPDESDGDWSQTLAEQERTPPPLAPSFILSLGNRGDANSPGNTRTDG